MKIYYAENKEDRLKYYQDWKQNKNGKAIRSSSHAKRKLKKKSQTQGFCLPNYKLINKIYAYTPEGYHVDHMRAISKGGDHHESNLCYLPEKINLIKGTKFIEGFADYIIYWQDTLNINPTD
jgi:hypothetical protein